MAAPAAAEARARQHQLKLPRLSAGELQPSRDDDGAKPSPLGAVSRLVSINGVVE